MVIVFKFWNGKQELSTARPGSENRRNLTRGPLLSPSQLSSTTGRKATGEGRQRYDDDQPLFIQGEAVAYTDMPLEEVIKEMREPVSDKSVGR